MHRTLCLILLLICFIAVQVRSQACGYVYARIHVSDSRGAPISNARFEFLANEKKEWAFHGREVVRWVEKDSSYFLSEGMCGGHRQVLVRVSSDGFEEARKVVDLDLRNPARPYVFRITLNRKDSRVESNFATYSFLSGRIFDANGALVTLAKVSATDASGKKYFTESDGNGEYLLELSYNQYESGSASFREAIYTIVVEKEGFKRSVMKDFVFVPSQFGEMRYDVALEVQSYSHPVVVGNRVSRFKD